MQTDPGLTPEHHHELARATERARGIRRAARVAAFNGWTIWIFAAITLLFGLGSAPAFLLGVGMGLVAWNELRGRRMLLDFDPDGALLLGRNQLGFMGMIVLYCVWSLLNAIVFPSPQQPELVELLAALGQPEELIRSLTITVYLAVILATLVFQGLNARFYFARRRMIEEFLRETPVWIVDLGRGEAG